MVQSRRTATTVALLLMLALFCSACSVPDISEFTKQSAEMTRGIRTGVTDTGKVIKSAAAREDLLSAETRSELRKQLKNYQEAVQPTIAALDALDEYLDALNALAQANAKSGDNAKAVVASVGNLVTAVSGLTLATTVVNVATGLVALEEQFRTAKNFKTRVNLAAVIVEGRFDEEKETFVENGKTKTRTRLVKACGPKAADIVATQGALIRKIVDPIYKPLSEAQKTTLKSLDDAGKLAKLAEWKRVSDELQAELARLKPESRRQRLVSLGIMTANQKSSIDEAEAAIAVLGCGAIDLIKFNMRELKDINQNVSQRIFDGVYRRNKTVLGFYDSLNANDRSTQRELKTILNYKSLVAQIRESRALGEDAEERRDNTIKLKELMDNLFIIDGTIRREVLAELDKCGATCADMKAFIVFPLCATCEAQALGLVDAMDGGEFDNADGYIQPVLERRAAELYAENTRYLDDLKRITPAHSAVIDELKTISDKQEQLDSVLSSSIGALDTWAKTHANLRVAVNSKKPLTVSALASRVREIWSIVDPASQGN
jgi:hypothetical protein